MSCAEVQSRGGGCGCGVSMAQPAAVSLADAFVEFRERKLLEKKKLRELRAKANEKKRTQSFKSHLRRKFVEEARRYLGVPYGKRFHVLDDDKECDCEGCVEAGRQLRDDPSFLVS